MTPHVGKAIVAILLFSTVAMAQLEPSDWIRITDDDNWDRYPSWSPDQSQMAFVRDSGEGMHLVIVDADGSNRNMLTDGRDQLSQPSWFPSGNRVVVNIWGKGLSAIDLATGGQESLFKPRQTSAVTPELSPDGLRIAYAEVPLGEDNTDIYISDLDGRNVTRLTNHGAQSNNPSWSHDGNTIAYDLNASPPGVYVTTLEGAAPRRLTPSSMYSLHSSWSPDGQTIAFSAWVGDSFDLFAINVDGTGLRRLTLTPATVVPESPVWSPDGRFVAFHAFENGIADIFVIEVDGAMSAVSTKSWANLKTSPARD